jgi:hypothetical protein
MVTPNIALVDDRERGPGNQMQGWVQNDKESHSHMWKLGVKHPTALAVLHFMISRLNRGAAGIVISAPAMARAMGISERTAKSATAILKDKKFVQILKSGNTNVYIVNSRVAWQGPRGARHAVFNAQILVDETEQLKTIEELEIEASELLEVPLIELESFSVDDVLDEDPQQKLL